MKRNKKRVFDKYDELYSLVLTRQRKSFPSDFIEGGVTLKIRILLVLAVMLLSTSLTVGCISEGEAVDAADIYSKSLEAVQEANSYVFEIDMVQIIHFSEPIPLTEGITTDKMETQSKITGRATENPLALEMFIKMYVPDIAEIPEAAEFAEMDLEMYMAEDQVYIYNPMFGGWIRQDMSEFGLGMEQLEGLGHAANDPMYLLNLLGDEGAEKATLETDNDHYIIILDDDDGTLMQNMMDEIKGVFGEDTLDPSIQAEMDEALKGMEFSKLSYKIWIDKETFLTAKSYMAYVLTMTVEDETMVTEQTIMAEYKDYGTIDSIMIPEEVKSSALTMEELTQDVLIQ